MVALNTPDVILCARLANQQLLCQSLNDPSDVVAHLGAVQSQDYFAAKWALALRLRDASHQQLEDAIADGRVLRTHVLRPTWHFVAPADIRWLLALTRPHVKAQMRPWTRSAGLDEATLARCYGVIERALAGGQSLTRTELAHDLCCAGFATPDRMALANVFIQAELDALVCSGPPRGRQQTYALVDERVAPAPELTREEALAQLTFRYFNSHGPALVQDCAWWSGLSLKDVRRGLELNSARLLREIFDGRDYWFSAGLDLSSSATTYLLPNYDEYTVAYKHRDLYYDAEVNRTGDPRADVPFVNSIVADGRVVGRWTRVPRRNEIAIDVRWSVEPSNTRRRAVDAATERYRAFCAALT